MTERQQKRSGNHAGATTARTAEDDAGSDTTRLSYAGQIPAVASESVGAAPASASDRAYGHVGDMGGRIRDLMTAADVVYHQAINDQTHAGLIREQEDESPVIAGTIKIAARVREMATLSPKGGLALPNQGRLDVLVQRLVSARQLLKRAEGYAKRDPASAESSVQTAEVLLKEIVNDFEPLHQQLTSYVERTGKGASLMIGALETTKLVAATAVIMGTGAGAAGLAGTTIAGVTIGSAGSFGGMTAIAGASAMSAGAMAGAYTAADQFGSDQWDPVAIARSAGAAAATTFLSSMLGGTLNKVFFDALAGATAGLAGQLGARAQAMLASSSAERFIALVAGSMSGGLTAATEAAVRKLAAGEHMSREEFCKIVIVEAIKSGLLQFAVQTALSQTKMLREATDKLDDKLVDRTNDPKADYEPHNYVLDKSDVRTHEHPDGLPNVHELLAPSKTDHNNAFFPKSSGGGKAPIGLSRDTYGAILGSDAKITADTLYVSAHGSPLGMSGGNRELALLTAKTIADLAEKGDPVARIVLNSCMQRDKRFGLVGKSNAEAFEALLKQAMKAHPNVTAPPVYAVEKAGSVTGGLFGDRAFINESVAPASTGGQMSWMGAATAGSVGVAGSAVAGIVVGELTDMLSEHPTRLELVIQWLREKGEK